MASIASSRFLAFSLVFIAPPASPVRMPMVDVGEGQMDVVSSLLKDRILLLGTQVD